MVSMGIESATRSASQLGRRAYITRKKWVDGKKYSDMPFIKPTNSPACCEFWTCCEFWIGNKLQSTRWNPKSEDLIAQDWAVVIK